MDQIFCVKLEKELNNLRYSLVLPVGAAWSDAIEVAKEFSAMVQQLAQEAIDRADQAKAATEPIQEA